MDEEDRRQATSSGPREPTLTRESTRHDSDRGPASFALVGQDSTSCEFISVDELAAELGLNRKTLYNAIKLRQVPGVRTIGSRIVVHRPTVLDWFRNGRGAVPRSRSKS